MTTQTLNIQGMEVVAVSQAGIETCIMFPGMGFAFDIGRCPEEAISMSKILLTHAHMDHVGGLPYHIGRRAGRGLGRPTYLVPHVIEESLHGVFAAFSRLDSSVSHYHMQGVHIGERYPLGKGYTAVPFESVHRVPCYGYKIFSTKKKLRAEYQGKMNDEILSLRKEGVEVSEEVETLRLAFTGDTTAEGLDNNPELYTADLLIVEASFLDDEIDAVRARSRGHIHIDDLVERAHLFQNKAVLLTHFSARHSPSQILSVLDKRLPSDLRAKVIPLLPPA